MIPDPSLSPSLRKDAGTAYELKFVLTLDEAARAEQWARDSLIPDPHGPGGFYRTLSLYCDTPARDVFYRSRGYRRNKYRLRRYEEAGFLHLERKTRRGDRVSKKRSVLALDALPLLEAVQPEADWDWSWFPRQIHIRSLAPAAKVGYSRTAFMGGRIEEPLRLTIDRDLVGELATGWSVEPLASPRPLLEGQAVLELKYADILPIVFKELLTLLPPNRPGGASKYRMCMRAWGLT